MNRIHILALVAWLGNLQLAHWQADTKSTIHETLGELYGDITPLLDQLIETEMGMAGTTDFPEGQSVVFTVNAPLGELLQVALDEIAAIRAEVINEGDLVNLLDEMKGIIRRAKFLLKV